MIVKYPAQPSACKVKCQRCHDCGELHCFQAEYGVGWYWEFCDCEIGKQVCRERHIEAGYGRVEQSQQGETND